MARWRGGAVDRVPPVAGAAPQLTGEPLAVSPAAALNNPPAAMVDPSASVATDVANGCSAALGKASPVASSHRAPASRSTAGSAAMATVTPSSDAAVRSDTPSWNRSPWTGSASSDQPTPPSVDCHVRGRHSLPPDAMRPAVGLEVTDRTAWVAHAAALVGHRQLADDRVPRAPVDRAPDHGIALAVAGQVGHAAGDEPAVVRGEREHLLAAGAAQVGGVDLFPRLAIGRVPDEAVLLVVDGAVPDGHEAVADRGDRTHGLFPGAVERPTRPAVDGRPLGAVGAEPQARPDLAPDVLAAGDEEAARARGHVERPLLVVAAHGGRCGEHPPVARAGPHGGVGLVDRADPADGHDAVVGAGRRGHALVLTGRLGRRRLPTGSVGGGPHGRDGSARIGLEQRADDHPLGFLARDRSHEVGHVGHRLLERVGRRRTHARTWGAPPRRRPRAPSRRPPRWRPRSGRWRSPCAACGDRGGGAGGEPAGWQPRLGRWCRRATEGGWNWRARRSSGRWSAPYRCPKRATILAVRGETRTIEASCRQERGPQVKVGVLALQGASCSACGHADTARRPAGGGPHPG